MPPYFHASFPWVPLVHLCKMPSWKKGTRNSVWQYSVHWLGMHTCQIIHQADIGTPALTKHVYYGICVTTNASSRVPHIHHVVSHFHIFAHATPTSYNAFCSPTTLLPGWIPPGSLSFQILPTRWGLGAPLLQSWVGILIIAYNTITCYVYMRAFAIYWVLHIFKVCDKYFKYMISIGKQKQKQTKTCDALGTLEGLFSGLKYRWSNSDKIKGIVTYPEKCYEGKHAGPWKYLRVQADLVYHKEATLKWRKTGWMDISHIKGRGTGDSEQRAEHL